MGELYFQKTYWAEHFSVHFYTCMLSFNNDLWSLSIKITIPLGNVLYVRDSAKINGKWKMFRMGGINKLIAKAHSCENMR
jgi:hypothetical protein